MQNHSVNFLYLFLIPPMVSVEGANKTPDKYYNEFYKVKEKHPSAVLEAYNFALQKKFMGAKLTEKFIEEIYKKTIPDEHYKNESEISYWDVECNYPLFSSQKNKNNEINLFYNATREGLGEFVTHWFSQEKCPWVVIYTDSKAQKITAFLKPDAGSILKRIMDVKLNRIQEKRFTISETIKSMSILFSEAKYEIEVNRVRIESIKIKNFIASNMSRLVKSYNEKIKASENQSNDTKLKIIVQHVQWIYQLRPFKDIFWVVILLNKLLRDNNLALTILLNSNQLDCFSVEQLIEEVKTGQQLFKKFLSNNGESFTLEVNYKAVDLKQITFNPMEIKYIDNSTATRFLQSMHDSQKENFEGNELIKLEKCETKTNQKLQNSSTILNRYLYAFLIPPITNVLKNKIDVTYQKHYYEEPGFANDLLAAYIFAFDNANKGKQLTVFFLKNYIKKSCDINHWKKA